MTLCHTILLKAFQLFSCLENLKAPEGEVQNVSPNLTELHSNLCRWAIAVQLVLYIYAFVSEKLDKDQDLQNETFSKVGSDMNRGNFWNIAVVGSSAIFVSGAVSITLSFREESGITDFLVVTAGSAAYFIVAGLVSVLIRSRRTKDLPVSEIYWSLQKGEISTKGIGDEYRNSLIAALGSRKNDRYQKKSEWYGSAVRSSEEFGLHAWLNWIGPGIFIVFLSILSIIETSRSGSNGIVVFVKISTLSTVAVCVCCFASRSRDRSLKRFYEVRAKTTQYQIGHCMEELNNTD